MFNSTYKQPSNTIWSTNKDRKNTKTFFILIIFIMLNGLFCNSQTLISDSLRIKESKLFLHQVINALTIRKGQQNHDSICRTFVPIDTIYCRLTISCLESDVEHYLDHKKYPNYFLHSNSLNFNEFNYYVDSTCTRSIEKNIVYVRICYAYKDFTKFGGKPISLVDPSYCWYKIWFDGEKYWLIPGHHYTDVLLDFNWTMCNHQYFTKSMAPWAACTD